MNEPESLVSQEDEDAIAVELLMCSYRKLERATICMFLSLAAVGFIIGIGVGRLLWLS